MKKVIAILTAVILVLSIGTTAFAANFTPSVEEKDAPTLVAPSKGQIKQEIKEQLKQEGTIALIVHTETDNVAHEISHSELVVTSVAEMDESKKIPKEAKEDLEKAYKDFSDKNKNIDKVVPAEVNKAITETVKKEMGNDKTTADLIVRDLFDVSLLNDEHHETLIDDEHHLLLTFSLGVKKDEFVTAIKFNPETKLWETIRSVVNNGDGTVTCEFDHLCPIAFLVEKTEANSGAAGDSAQTGDNSVSLYVWIAIAAATAGLMVILFVVKNKKEKSAE